MPRGGARPGAGRKKKPTPEVVQVRQKDHAAQLLAALNRPASEKDSYEVQKFRLIDDAGVTESSNLRKWLYDKRDGLPVRTVNHLHDKPLEMNVNFTLSEKMRAAMEKAEKRVSERS